ncbi:hypothetical protein J7W08_06610 [Methanococcoides orientis]|uniref:hypothetical protein n=1 Tax=Methanococcoides orientis TaxID=2822137 RepID=UPI001E61B650|nr:hypothetical protein [Methanococcoides orientis]UGV39802.1 hypothetical protein J7W08_06610 [Methanococcoides orientis]
MSLLAISIYVVSTYLIIGPGLPPAEIMKEWYLPDRASDKEADLSLFPTISEYSAAGSYSNSTIMCVWYFEKKSSFLEGELKLSEYLKKSGQFKIVEINITNELDAVINDRGKNWQPTNGPRVFNATRYQGTETSGYFIVYRTPFLETSEDYFITYYGTKDTTNFTGKQNDILYLIARSYYLGEGNVTSLDIENSQDRKNSLLSSLKGFIGWYYCPIAV